MISKLRGLYKQLIRVGFISTVATILTFPALAAALTSTPSIISLLVLVPLVYIGVSLNGDLPQIRSRLGRKAAIGNHLIPRTLLLTVCAVTSTVNNPSSSLPVIAVGFVALAMSMELATRTISERILPIALGLPGFKRPNTLAINLSWIQLLSLAWTGLYIPTLTLGKASGVTLLLSAAILLGMGIAALAHTIQTWRVQSKSTAALTEAISAYAPRFALHWEAPANTSYQVKMWLPYLEQAGVNFFIFVRTTKNFEEVAALTNRPIVLRSGINDIDAAIVPSLRAVLYVNTATVNNHVVRFTELTHIQLNHGDSDKAASSNPAFKVFTRNFVAGQAAIDRFSRNGVTTAPDFFEIVGRPQVSGIELATPLKLAANPKTVLYAPTWHGFYEDSDYSSLKIGTVLVQTLVEAGNRVIFRPHPYSYRSASYRRIISKVESYLEEQNTLGGVQHLFGKQAATPLIHELFNQSDALISDVSSVVTDYLQSEKPMSVVCINQLPQDLAKTMPVSKAAYVLEVGGPGETIPASKDLKTRVQDIIDDLLVTDSLQSTRLALKKYYLGDLPRGEEASLFVSTLQKYVHQDR